MGFIKMLALVLGLACAHSASAQTFKRVTVKGGVPIAQISAGGASVWAIGNNGNTYVLKGKQFVLASSISLTQISVGGGSALQADTVWGLNSAGSIYTATKSGTTWVFSQVPGVLHSIAVGIGYHDYCHPYEVWGINTATQIYRYDFCGKKFNQIPGSLTSLDVGGGDMWGLNGNGQIFRFNFATGGFDQLPGVLTSIAVGPNGLWGLYQVQIYQFCDNIQNFVQLPGSVSEIHAGGDGVWGSDPLGSIFHLEPSSSTFMRIPGTLIRLSVGSGGGVWGIDDAGRPYAFTTP
jgi:hypothetical protein